MTRTVPEDGIVLGSADGNDKAGARVRGLTGLVARFGSAVIAPSSRGVASSRLDAVASVLFAAGLLTLSWELFGNVGIGPYNLKLPVLLLTIAAVLSVQRWWAWLRKVRVDRSAVRWVVGLGVAVVLLFVVRALTSFPWGPGLAQVAAVLSGAVLPALAVLGGVRSRADAVWALRWLVRGAVVTGVFGLYQLTAFYLGLPQGIAYTGVGTSGAGGRISAFSYEPAYFAYFLLIAVGAVIAIARLTGREVGWPAIVFFTLVLVLVNVRALLFLVPLFAVLLSVAWRRNRGLLLRTAPTAIVLLGVTALVSLVLAAAASSTPTDAPGPVAPSTETSAPPSLETTPDPPSRAVAAPPAPQLPDDVLDPAEPTSNGPRLDLYRAVLQVDLQNPLFGVGPGHLGDALAADGYVPPNQGPNVVANNIWLQAAADGGVGLLLLEAALVAALAVLWWRSRRTAAHPLASALIAVVLVGGMLTSYLFDVKIWVALALVLALVVEAQDTARPASASA